MRVGEKHISMSGLLFSIIILSTFTSLCMTHLSQAERSIIFVDVAYSMGGEDGSIDHPYTSIQQAIHMAKEGDSIFVFEGTYNETLVIDKQVNITALYQNTTIINRDGKTHRYLIEISADHVKLENFTISDTRNNNLVSLIYVTGDYVQFYNNNLTLCNNWAFYLDDSHDCTLGNNTLYGTKGIYLTSSDNNVISNNNFTYCSEASIKLAHSSDNIVIYNNTFNHTTYAVFSQDGSNYNISNNRVNDSTFDGFRITSGRNNTLLHNYLMNNSASGIDISSTQSTIKNNKFYNNQIGLSLQGIQCAVAKNFFNDSLISGIQATQQSLDNLFYQNYFLDNSVNAKDAGDNQWFFNRKGNYWDDYNNVDIDRNKIGDEPYIISGSNIDYYPLGYFLKPPDKPTGPSPVDKAEGVGLSVTLKINISDNDSSLMDVSFYRATDDSLIDIDYHVATNSTASGVLNLDFDTTFLWYAIADDGKQENRSNIWIFTTQSIPSSNKDPLADPGGPYTATVGEILTLDSSASSDPDGNIDFYRWNFGDGSDETLEVSPNHIYSDPGTYRITLTVVDNDGRANTATTTVSISQTISNSPPFALLSGPSNGEIGQLLSFSGSESYDTDGSIVSYSWNFSDGTIATGSTVNKIFNQTGTFKVTLIVKDNKGTNTSSTLSLTIVSPEESTPGFEFIILLFALLILIRKRQKV